MDVASSPSGQPTGQPTFSTREWYQVGADIDGEGAGDKFGWSVSLSSDGNRVAIGARYNDGGGANSGHVRVFEYESSSSSWTQLGSNIDGEGAGDESGYAVSLSSNGSRLAIGALKNDGVDGTDSGHVRVVASQHRIKIYIHAQWSYLRTFHIHQHKKKPL